MGQILGLHALQIDTAKTMNLRSQIIVKKRANDKNQNRQCKAIKLVFLLQQTQDMIRLTWWKESKL